MVKYWKHDWRAPVVVMLLCLVFYGICFAFWYAGLILGIWRLFIFALEILFILCCVLLLVHILTNMPKTANLEYQGTYGSLKLWWIGTAIISGFALMSARNHATTQVLQDHSGVVFPGGVIKLYSTTDVRAVKHTYHDHYAAYGIVGNGQFLLVNPPLGFPNYFIVQHEGEGVTWSQSIAATITAPVEIDGNVQVPADLQISSPILVTGRLQMPVVYAKDASQNGKLLFINTSAVVLGSQLHNIWIAPQGKEGLVVNETEYRAFSWLYFAIALIAGLLFSGLLLQEFKPYG